MKEKKRNLVVRIILGCIIGTFIPMICSAFTIAWFIANTRADNQVADGEIGLRNYFYRSEDYQGDGSLEKPHEIVTPTHFYNLTRLQNLGVFPKHTYFRVGHHFNGIDNPPQCLDTNGNQVDVLDMTAFCRNNPLLPIGSEGTPFYGSFDGSLIPINGLRIAGNPEDVGVFGYTSYSSEVINLVCTNLEVSSLGYSTSGETNFLYSETIEDIFSEAATNFETASLSFNDGETDHNLKTLVPFVIEDLDAHLIENSDLLEGGFVLHEPTVSGNHNIEYSLCSSTGVIYKEQNGDNFIVDLSKLPVEFNETEAVKMYSSLSIVAAIKINGIRYSRVIQNYKIEISYAPLVEDGPNKYSLKVDCDYVYDDSHNPINFAHGNNIGYLVGHADGNVNNCYVYNGTLLFNNDNASLHNVETQTETGLIGKVGNNVTTDIDPTNTNTNKGETGVLNFSHIYSLIRDPFEAGQVTFAGYDNTYDSSAGTVTGEKKTFISYATEHKDSGTGTYPPCGVNSDTFDLFSDYLRTDTDTPYKHYITSAGNQQDIKDNNNGAGSSYTIPSGTLDKMMNSVDFTWNKVICDGETAEESRGLGVFKIVTGYSSLAKNPSLASSIWRNEIGECAIIRETGENVKTAIYFSTAECDWLNGGGWNKDTGNINPARMNTLPSYTDSKSFQYPFSRDFNYVFKLDLSQAADYKIKSEIYDYMYNTDSEFLKNYLGSKLIDRRGKPVVWKNKAFGFKVQFSQDSLAPVTELNSYMTIGQPGTLQQYSVNGESQYLPPKSVAFSIENPNGANVAIAGCDGDISIYGYNPDNPALGVTELYTMRSANNKAANNGRAFEYSSNGATNTVVTPLAADMKDTDWLYGHIFTLPRGNYVIGSSKKTGSTSAKLYYVCVQGQTNGDLGDLEVATIGNFIHDIDFLLKDPTDPLTPFDLNDQSFFANFSFSGNFTTDIGKFVIDIHNGNIRARFNDFITYLLFYCRKNNPEFEVNNNEISGEALYTFPLDDYTVWEP